MASVEAASEHPIAKAIIRAASDLSLHEPHDFETIPGLGACAIVDDHKVLVGSDRFMASEGIVLGGLASAGAKISEAGGTPVYLAVDGVATAAAGVTDTVKADARDVV